MTAESLELHANNNREHYDAITAAVRSLRATIDRCAAEVAKGNADWHDDPAADDHAEHHAPAGVQFPREVRDEAILSLVRYYLSEFTIQERQ